MIDVGPRRGVARAVFFLLITATCWSRTAAAAASLDAPLPIVEPNDNRRAARTLKRGTLTLALRAGAGRWQPEGPASPTLEIDAFGEAGKALTVPAPLIRVVEGTEILVSLRNDLDAALVVHGLVHARWHAVRTAAGAATSNRRGAIQERSCRNVPLLGIDDWRTRAFPRAGWCACRRWISGRRPNQTGSW